MRHAHHRRPLFAPRRTALVGALVAAGLALGACGSSAPKAAGTTSSTRPAATTSTGTATSTTVTTTTGHGSTTSTSTTTTTGLPPTTAVPPPTTAPTAPTTTAPTQPPGLYPPGYAQSALAPQVLSAVLRGTGWYPYEVAKPTQPVHSPGTGTVTGYYWSKGTSSKLSTPAGWQDVAVLLRGVTCNGGVPQQLVVRIRPGTSGVIDSVPVATSFNWKVIKLPGSEKAQNLTLSYRCVVQPSARNPTSKDTRYLAVAVAAVVGIKPS